jgi:hypothetical protein
MSNQNKIIQNTLLSLGIPPSVKGFFMWRTAFEILLADNSSLVDKSITKKLYPAIAEMHNTDSRKAERCLRHAQEMASDHEYKTPLWQELFHFLRPGDRVTNTLFASRVLLYLKDVLDDLEGSYSEKVGGTSYE